jgi:exosortase/archaeosortase family protein
MKRKNSVINKTTLRESFLFLVRLNLFLIPFYAVLLSGLELGILKELTLLIVIFVLHLMGLSPVRDGIQITVMEPYPFGAQITWDCTGWESMFLFVALVFATKTSTNSKIHALKFLPLIYLVNIFRIVFVFYFVSALGFRFFDVIHTLVWPWIMVFATLSIWVFWFKGSKTSL